MANAYANAVAWEVLDHWSGYCIQTMDFIVFKTKDHPICIASETFWSGHDGTNWSGSYASETHELENRTP